MMTLEKQRELVLAGPGTPAGTYLRSFWQPVALSSAIGEQPHRLKIMNEDLVAYRDGGKVRLLSNRCPHRGTTLHTGRRVAGGHLQCAYHGWTFNGEGQCVAQPCEPEGSTMAARIRIASYPTLEMHGLVFAYMGAGEPPPFRRPEHADRDDGVHNANVVTWNCNYFQCLENNPDPMHTAFTHPSMKLWIRSVPKFEIEETDYGIHMRAIRGDYVRHTHFRLPNVLSITNEYWEPPTHLTTWIVPVDDTHALTFRYFFTPTPNWRVRLKVQLAWRFLQHRLDAIVNEDKLVQEGQGEMADRSREHLGHSDRGIAILRRRFQEGMRAVRAAPPAGQGGPAQAVPSESAVLET
ncbi:MAG TPA: aromatic ring-hydroxylating dioxygenase subunit alpha [Burkholderiales bacterium]